MDRFDCQFVMPGSELESASMVWANGTLHHYREVSLHLRAHTDFLPNTCHSRSPLLSIALSVAANACFDML